MTKNLHPKIIKELKEKGYIIKNYKDDISYFEIYFKNNSSNNKIKRTFLNKPIGNMTKRYFKNPISIETFINNITSAMKPFSTNMKNLNLNDNKYMEEWMELFIDWFEISKKIR